MSHSDNPGDDLRARMLRGGQRDKFCELAVVERTELQRERLVDLSELGDPAWQARPDPLRAAGQQHEQRVLAAARHYLVHDVGGRLVKEVRVLDDEDGRSARPRRRERAA